MGTDLQAIIGVDKNNPLFTIFRNKKEKTIIVYFGMAQLESVEDKPDNPNLKLLIARLFNSGVKKQSLVDNFGYSYNTIRRWSDAIKSGNAQKIVHALSGQGATKKLTVEMQSFVSHRFKSVYAENKYSYSQEIRDEILEVFKQKISSETLRPLFNELKEKYFKKKSNTYRRHSE